MHPYRILAPLLCLHCVAAIAVAGGTPAGAELFADLNDDPAAVGSPSERWVRAGSWLYFQRDQDGETSLWRTDGSAAGTLRVRDFDSFGLPTILTGAGLPDGRLIFDVRDQGIGREPWISDGTAAGTRLLADLCSGSCASAPRGFVRFGDEVLFRADTGPDHRSPRLFAADGAGNLRQVSDLEVRLSTTTPDRVFMLVVGDERTLWAGDGTPGSEQLVATLEVEAVWDLVSVGSQVLVVADGLAGDTLELYFSDDQGIEQIGSFAYDDLRQTIGGDELAYVLLGDRLIRTDGTPEGTFALAAVTGREPRLSFIALVGDRAFFAITSSSESDELWTSDGTQEGTLRLTEFAPLEVLSRPTALGSRLVFFVDGGFTGAAPTLWSSDGSAAGTAELRVFEDVDARRFLATPLGLLGDRVYFAADGGATGLEPWSSDGTAAGTALVDNLWPDVAASDPRDFVARGADVVFEADGGGLGVEFFRAESDGSVELAYVNTDGVPQVRALGPAGSRVVVEAFADYLGPTRVTAFDPETGDEDEILQVPRTFDSAVLGDRLAMLTGRQVSSGAIRYVDDLWVTEGTPETTLRLLQVGDDEYAAPQRLQTWRGELYFAAHDAATGSELWRTDGTPGGTRRVADLEPGPGASDPWLLAASEDRLFVRARVGGEPALVTLGAADGLRVLNVTAPSGAVALGERLVWTADSMVWVSDGSAGGTMPVHPVDRFGPLVRSGDRAFFSAFTPEHGLELWATDGTAAGTGLVLDAEPGPVSSEPAELTDAGGILAFSARTAAAGREPWASNGTAEGTRRLADVAPGVAGSVPRHFTFFDDRILFSARRDDVGRELFSLPRAAFTAVCEATESAMCLGGGRFRLEVEWRDFDGDTGSGRVVPQMSEDSGLFYFFDPDNWEMLVKVLDGCGFNRHFWVFSAATTNVEYTLRVTDTARAVTREYFNPLGTAAAAVTDTEAFATCP